MSVYYYKSSEKNMVIRATLQTKLACGALMIIIINVCFLIAVIAFISKEEMCKIKNEEVKNASFQSRNPSELELQTSITEHPWMLAFLILPDEIFIGTAAIITQKWAITTAYSVVKVSKYPISKKGFRGGSTFWNREGFYHFAAKIIPHEKFDPSTLDYNVALIQVVRPFVHVNEKPISIANKQFMVEDDIAQITGWAAISNPKNFFDHLLRVPVILLPEKLCMETLNKMKNDTSIFRSLCAYRKKDEHKTECDFSSGSGLIVNKYLIGLASSGVMCSESHLPGIYTNLTKIINWIETIEIKKEILADVIDN